MASKPITSVTLPLLKKLEDQLTCGICLDLFTNPQSLPCLHSFCQRCVERLPVRTPRGDKDLITCPTCRTTSEIPVKFLVAFHLNILKEVYSLLKKADQEDVKCEMCTTANANGYCKNCHQFFCQNCDQMHRKLRGISEHKFLTLKDLAGLGSQLAHEKEGTTMSFCETCEELIYCDCTIGNHDGHKFSPINDCYDEHHQKLQTALKAVKEKQENVFKKITFLTETEIEIRENSEEVKQKIHQTAKEMIDAIQESERKLTAGVESAADCKLHVLSSQKKSAESSFSRLKECGEYVKQSLEMNTHKQVLSSMKQMMDRMKLVKEEINEDDYNPLEASDLSFRKNKNITELNHIGDICYFTTSVLKECKIKKINTHQVTFENETFSFPLAIELPNLHLAIVPVFALRCSIISTTPINITTVTTTGHPGVYKVHCTPIIRGNHQVSVTVRQIELGSVPVVVPFNPYLDTITPIRTIEGLNKPYGVAINEDGHVIVTEWGGNCVTVIDKEGRKIKSFVNKYDEDCHGYKNTEFSSPSGIAVDPNNSILVADDHKIQKISTNVIFGEIVESVGCEGNKPLEFFEPCGIAISPITGKIYIADCSNHRIQVLNSDLSFSFKFRVPRRKNFQYPRFLTIDSQGIVYVCDYGNHHIRKFTADGKYISQFCFRGSNPGQLQLPIGIATANDLLYVTEYDNNRISIFSTDGKFIRCFGSRGTDKSQFISPHGIAFDNEGFLYICDFNNGRLVVY